jgi:hypothetical protein
LVLGLLSGNSYWSTLKRGAKDFYTHIQ